MRKETKHLVIFWKIMRVNRTCKKFVGVYFLGNVQILLEREGRKKRPLFMFSRLYKNTTCSWWRRLYKMWESSSLLASRPWCLSTRRATFLVGCNGSSLSTSIIFGGRFLIRLRFLRPIASLRNFSDAPPTFESEVTVLPKSLLNLPTFWLRCRFPDHTSQYLMSKRVETLVTGYWKAKMCLMGG